MSLEPPALVPVMPAVDRKAIALAQPRVQSAARWFWWIAGLSVVNSVVVHSGGNFNFVLGLAVTQFFDGLFASIKPVAFAFDAIPVGFFILAGVFAKRGHLWAFVIGGVAYAIDGVIYGYFGAWLPVAFHVYALFCIFTGVQALRGALAAARQQQANREAAAVAAATMVPPVVTADDTAGAGPAA